jgi:hypothetical protein
MFAMVVIISIGVFFRILYRIDPQDTVTEFSLLQKDHKIMQNEVLNEDKNELHLISASYCLFPNVRKDIGVYLRALQHSVSIISLPPSLSSAVVKRYRHIIHIQLHRRVYK